MDVYSELLREVAALLEGEDDLICAMANTAAAIFHRVPRLNWAGFYRAVGDTLVLGPFQGKVACTRIARGRGVCGAAMAEDRPQLVPDVHRFPGHIACDSASNAEVVVPLHGRDGALLGVLDIDSPVVGRFGPEDLAAFTALAALFEQF